MGDSRRITVRVAEVLPNGGNPRRDAGDIDALARSIAATGGQPVQPIIVVPDGRRWRLVDGWRRWLAMRQLGTKECAALCFDRMGDAEEAVCAMATDSKKALDSHEAACGFQSMLALGVSDERVAGVTGVAATLVRRVRGIRTEVPEQATMDGMIAAASDDFTDEERIAIMRDACPYDKARVLREAHRRAAILAEIREVLDAVEYRKGRRPYDPEEKGLSYLGYVMSAASAREFSEAHADVAEMVAYQDGDGYAVYRVMGEEDMSEAEAEESELRRRRDAHRQAYRKMFLDMVAFVTARLDARRLPKYLGELAVGDRRVLGLIGFEDDEVDELARQYVASDASQWELWLELRRVMLTYGLLGRYGEVNRFSATTFAKVYDALVADGWGPSDDAKEIRAMCDGGDGE